MPDDSDTTVFVEQIRVKLRLNIPGRNNAESLVDLTKDILVLPEFMTAIDRQSLNTYPYFTKSRLYPKEYITGLRYDQQIKFFFNEATFSQTIKTHSTGNPCDDINMDTRELENVYSADSDSAASHELRTTVCNAELMVSVLFPTVFPRLNNNVSSFAQYIQGLNNSRVTIRGAIPSMFESTLFNTAKQFSYLKIDGKQYTVAKTTWLNDFVNHPVYQKMADEYKAFNLWRDRVRIELVSEITSAKKQILAVIDNSKNVHKDVNTATGALSTLAISLKDRQNMQNIETYANELSQQLITFFDSISSKDELVGVESDISDEEQFANVDDKLEMVSSIASNLEMVKSASAGFRLPPALDKILTTITGLRTKIVSAQNICSQYLATNINSNFIDDQSISESEKQGRFKEYKTYIENLKNYVYPTRTMTNDKVQLLISNFAQNIDSDFNKYIHYVVQRYFMNHTQIRFPKSSNAKKYLSKFYQKTHPTTPVFVGICRMDSENIKYEMHVQVDLIGEIITSDTLHKFSCDYKDSFMGDMYLKYMNAQIYMNKWRVNPDAFYYAFPKKGKVATEIPISLIDTNKSDTTTTKGGRVSRRKIKRKKKRTAKTRARYFT